MKRAVVNMGHSARERLKAIAKALDDAVIPDSVKNLSLGELEGTPVRVKNMLNNIGVCTLWELVHFYMAKCRKYRGGFFASKHRMAELLYAIKEAIDLFSNPPKRGENSFCNSPKRDSSISYI